MQEAPRLRPVHVGFVLSTHDIEAKSAKNVSLLQLSDRVYIVRQLYILFYKNFFKSKKKTNIYIDR